MRWLTLLATHASRGARRHHRRRRTAVGLVLTVVVSIGIGLVAYAGSGGAAAVGDAAVDTPSTISAAVEPSGVAVGPLDSWRVARSGVGRYELDFGRPVRLVVDSWDQTATVVLRPITERRWLVEFIDGHHAVDSAFSFTAAPLP